jgi:hypothetical protein
MGIRKYKEASNLLIQLLDAQQLIPTKYKEYVILGISDLLPNVKILN